LPSFPQLSTERVDSPEQNTITSAPLSNLSDPEESPKLRPPQTVFLPPEIYLTTNLNYTIMQRLQLQNNPKQENLPLHTADK
jgi:hypothetical protein